MDDVTLFLGKMEEIVPTLEPQSVDAILTDLPYGRTACSWDVIIPFADLWRVVKHILKPRGVFVTTASQPFTSALVMSNPGWFRYEWIWQKTQATGHLDANRRPMKEHENIIVFSANGHIYNPQIIPKKKENIRPFTKRAADIQKVYGKFNPETPRTIPLDMTYPRTVIRISNSVGDRYHNTQKPVALYEYLIRTYTNPGDLVGDFCFGSGTTGVAAVNTGRRFVGCELREDYYQIAQRRIAEAQRQIRMTI